MKLQREVRIGLFAIAMLVCLYLGVNYLKGTDIFTGDRIYYATFDETLGLQKTAPVLLRGVKVGSVTDISIDPAAPDAVVVEVGIKKSVRVPVDSRLKLFSNGIMGGKAIELVRGEATGYFERGATIPSETAAGLLENASLGLDDLMAEAKLLMASLSSTSASLDSLFTQNAEAINGIAGNLQRVTGQIASSRIDGMIGDLRSFTTMLAGSSTRVEGIVGNLEKVTGGLAEANLRGTIDTLGVSIGHLNAVLAKISQGEGTLGRLMENPALYDSLTSATSNLSALLADVKANPKRYVHISVF